MNGNKLEYTVYIDVFFWKNFFLMFVLLMSVVLWQKMKIPIKRVFLGAALFSGVCVILLFLPVPLRFYGTIVLQGITLWGISFFLLGIQGKQGQWRILISFVIFTFYYNGFFSFLDNIRSLKVVGKVGILFIGLCLLGVGIRQDKKKKYYRVTIPCQDKMIQVVALRDSGNLLREPIQGTAVCIMERKCFPKEVGIDGVFMVPYRTVGTENGLLTAVMFRDVTIEGRLCKIECKKMLIGLYDGELSPRGNYQMILHEDYLGREE